MEEQRNTARLEKKQVGRRQAGRREGNVTCPSVKGWPVSLSLDSSSVLGNVPGCMSGNMPSCLAPWLLSAAAAASAGCCCR